MDGIEGECMACGGMELGYYTPLGAGPFCSECWEALRDPEQALLNEKRLDEAERKIEELRDGLEELQCELQMSLMRDKGDTGQ
jgi:hypothetical protein